MVSIHMQYMDLIQSQQDTDHQASGYGGQAAGDPRGWMMDWNGMDDDGWMMAIFFRPRFDEDSVSKPFFCKGIVVSIQLLPCRCGNFQLRWKAVRSTWTL